MPKQNKQKTQTPDKEVPQYDNVIKDKKKILEQYLKEKDFAIKVRQTKINYWLKNEDAYNGVTQKTLLTRANLHVPVVFEGVQNMSSKLGSAPEFKYETIPEGDENASEIMKHVVKEDLDECEWDLLYDQSKTEAGIYGRTIYKVIPGNDKNRVELVDTLAYLISPIAKNTRDALYQGQQFIYKTIEELYEEAEEMEYDMESLNYLKENKIPNETQVTTTTEASAKSLRMAQLGLANTTQFGSKVVDITEWWTYIKKGKKAELYCLSVANDMYVIRCVKASELGLKRPPFISWGTYTRGITFWCPSVADIYRDPGLAVDTNINQVIDNNTYRNFGMMFVASSSGLKQSSIVPRPLGITSVQVAPNESIQSKIYRPEIPAISDALTTMQTIKGFADSASGINPNVNATRGKLSVTQQANISAQIEQKIAVMRRNAILACQEMYQLMADITKDKLTKPRKVKIFGYKNITLEDVTRKNFEGVELRAKASAPEDSAQNKAIKQKAKIELYNLFKDDPKIPGQLSLRRSVAKTFDIEPDEIESFFTEEEKTPQELAPMNQGEEKTPNLEKVTTEATPLLSQTGKEAQINVPKSIK